MDIHWDLSLQSLDMIIQAWEILVLAFLGKLLLLRVGLSGVIGTLLFFMVDSSLLPDGDPAFWRN